jgi:aquaporin Z
MSTTTTRQVPFPYPAYLKRLVAEFIGTFFLVLVASMTIAGKSDLAPLAIGIILMIMVFAGGHISGGHFNPAVTLGVWSNQGIRGYWMILYFLVQIGAAAVAAGVAGWLLPDGYRAGPVASSGWLHVCLAEGLGTFTLVYTVLNVTAARATANNGFYGLAIGLTITAMAYALGGVSGGIFNPALAVGMYIMGAVSKLELLTYFAGSFAGAVLASFLFKIVDTEQDN